MFFQPFIEDGSIQYGFLPNRMRPADVTGTRSHTVSVDFPPVFDILMLFGQSRQIRYEIARERQGTSWITLKHLYSTRFAGMRSKTRFNFISPDIKRGPAWTPNFANTSVPTYLTST